MAEYRIVKLDSLNSIQQRGLLELFVEADFSDNTVSCSWLDDAVKGSLLAVAAEDDSGRIIGFARVLGDGVSDCYIQDVVVKSSCRRQGIGRKLIEFALAELKKRSIDWVGLIATPGNAEFYRRLGFEPMNGFTPMVLKKYE